LLGEPRTQQNRGGGYGPVTFSSHRLFFQPAATMPNTTDAGGTFIFC
jgi:hypothetical protein